MRRIAQPYRVIGSNLLDRLVPTDCHHQKLGLEIRSVAAALVPLLRRRQHLRLETLFRRGLTDYRGEKMGLCPKKLGHVAGWF